MSIALVPVSRADVRLFIERHHRHHHKPNTWIACVGVANDAGALVCVAVLERPKARMLCNAANAEASRVASDGSAPHAASKAIAAIAAIARAALALGYSRLVSYTLLGEAGTSYRAAGWWPVAVSAGGSWDRPSRPRDLRDSPAQGEKIRWEFGPDALPIDHDVDALVREMVGKVPLPKRANGTPLFPELAEGGSP